MPRLVKRIRESWRRVQAAFAKDIHWFSAVCSEEEGTPLPSFLTLEALFLSVVLFHSLLFSTLSHYNFLHLYSTATSAVYSQNIQNSLRRISFTR